MEKRYFAVEVTEDVSYDLSRQIVRSTTIVEADDADTAFLTMLDTVKTYVLDINVREATPRDLRIFGKATVTA